MSKNIIILIIYFFLFYIDISAQCKDISIGRTEMDQFLLSEYKKIKTDTFLVINYGSSLLKYHGWGIIITKKSGKIYATKLSLNKNDKIISKTLKRKKTIKHIEQFFADSLWKIKEKIYQDPNIVVFDPYLLKIHYHDNLTDWCLYFKKGLSGLKSECYNDKRVIWLNKLINKEDHLRLVKILINY